MKKFYLYMGVSCVVIILIIIVLVLNKTYKVDFHTQGGTIYKSQNVKKGDLAINPGNPSLDGYVFLYWVDEKTNEIFTFDMPIEKNIVLKAVYQNEITSEIV